MSIKHKDSVPIEFYLITVILILLKKKKWELSKVMKIFVIIG